MKLARQEEYEGPEGSEAREGDEVVRLWEGEWALAGVVPSLLL